MRKIEKQLRMGKLSIEAATAAIENGFIKTLGRIGCVYPYYESSYYRCSNIEHYVEDITCTDGYMYVEYLDYRA